MCALSTAALRQWTFPREFRIAAPPPHSDVTIPTPKTRPGQVVPPPAAAAQPDLRSLAAVATGLWRLQRKMRAPDGDRPTEEMRRAYRHLESTWDALAEAGVKIQDHTGMTYDSGLMLKVAAFQPTAGITREKVSETIKPSVYYQGRSIQTGEVIVATPEDPSAESDSPP